jgi:hypothetical protein
MWYTPSKAIAFHFRSSSIARHATLRTSCCRSASIHNTAKVLKWISRFHLVEGANDVSMRHFDKVFVHSIECATCNGIVIKRNIGAPNANMETWEMEAHSMQAQNVL